MYMSTLLFLVIDSSVLVWFNLATYHPLITVPRSVSTLRGRLSTLSRLSASFMTRWVECSAYLRQKLPHLVSHPIQKISPPNEIPYSGILCGRRLFRRCRRVRIRQLGDCRRPRSRSRELHSHCAVPASHCVNLWHRLQTKLLWSYYTKKTGTRWTYRPIILTWSRETTFSHFGKLKRWCNQKWLTNRFSHEASKTITPWI